MVSLLIHTLLVECILNVFNCTWLEGVFSCREGDVGFAKSRRSAEISGCCREECYVIEEARRGGQRSLERIFAEDLSRCELHVH